MRIVAYTRTTEVIALSAVILSNTYHKRQTPEIVRRVSLVFLLLAAVTLLFGISLIFLGHVKSRIFINFVDSVILTDGFAKLIGSTVPLLEKLINRLINQIIFINFIGIALLCNGLMMRYQPWERCKDFFCVEPALLFFTFFVYYPFAELVRVSFTNWNLLNNEYIYVGFKNYNWLIYGSGWKYLMETLRVTIYYTFWEVTVTMIAGFMLALLFSRMTKAFALMRAALFLPRFIMISSSAIVFAFILNTPNGLLNNTLSLFGVQGPDWLIQQDTALISVLFLSSWRMAGYVMMVFLYTMQAIPKCYYEAAHIDGADSLQRFRFITLPLLKPTTLFLLITTCIAGMKVFETVNVMTNGGPHDATNVIVHWIYLLAFEDNRMDRASAVSVLFFLCLFIFTVATMHLANRETNKEIANT